MTVPAKMISVAAPCALTLPEAGVSQFLVEECGGWRLRKPRKWQGYIAHAFSLLVCKILVKKQTKRKMKIKTVASASMPSSQAKAHRQKTELAKSVITASLKPIFEISERR